MDRIYVIRHAEKPNGDARGVDGTGSPDPESLTPQGWQRAGALAVFFGSRSGLPAPSRIYAAGPEKTKIAPHTKAGSKSQRPVETVTPLAAKLGLTPLATYTKDEETGLVNEVVALKGITLICWQHEAIPEIAQLVLGSSKGIPHPWPADRFDLVWSFTRAASGQPWSFGQICQRLLAGDRSEPIT
jgi:broad specificity phosphatase PhoE